MSDNVHHPSHYGGMDDPYEAIKVIEAWGADFHLGNVLKYINRAGKKPGAEVAEDLLKALWYLRRALESRNIEVPCPDCELWHAKVCELQRELNEWEMRGVLKEPTP